MKWRKRLFSCGDSPPTHTRFRPARRGSCDTRAAIPVRRRPRAACTLLPDDRRAACQDVFELRHEARRAYPILVAHDIDARQAFAFHDVVSSAELVPPCRPGTAHLADSVREHAPQADLLV